MNFPAASGWCIKKIIINLVVCFKNWFFGFGYYLDFGYWDLEFWYPNRKENYFFMNLMELTLTFPGYSQQVVVFRPP